MRANASSIQLQNWGWRYATRKAWALAEVSFSIEPGERVLLLGASGSGKSTLLRGLAGVLGGPEEGEQRGKLLIDGEYAERARGRVGLILQDPDSQVILARVGDDVAFGAENLGIEREEIWRRVSAALEAVGLDLPLNHPTNTLSGGQKQRLAIAGVLAMAPGLLLLDEPTANLDAAGEIEVKRALMEILEKNHSTFIVIEHRVEVWQSLVNRIIILAPGGGILADGDPDEILRTQGKQLAAQGIWVPEYPPTFPLRKNHGSGELLLTATDLSIGRDKKAPLLQEINVELRAGEALALLGANASGKSTLALTLGGLIPPLEGKLIATSAGVNLRSEPFKWSSRELASQIGNVFQDPEHQFISSTVRTELEVGGKVLNLAPVALADRIDELLARFRLTHLASANPFTLSGGEKRRLSVATVLVTAPRILILDEPTFGQDSKTWEELLLLLAQLLDSGSAIVASTHDQNFVDAIANREFNISDHQKIITARNERR